MRIKGIYKNIGIKSSETSFTLFTDDVFENKTDGSFYLKEDRSFAYYGSLEQCLIGLKKYILRADNSEDFNEKYKDLVDYKINTSKELAIDTIDKLFDKLDNIDNKIIDFVNTYGKSCLEKKDSKKEFDDIMKEK